MVFGCFGDKGKKKERLQSLPPPPVDVEAPKAETSGRTLQVYAAPNGKDARHDLSQQHNRTPSGSSTTQHIDEDNASICSAFFQSVNNDPFVVLEDVEVLYSEPLEAFSPGHAFPPHRQMPAISEQKAVAITASGLRINELPVTDAGASASGSGLPAPYPSQVVAFAIMLFKEKGSLMAAARHLRNHCLKTGQRVEELSAEARQVLAYEEQVLRNHLTINDNAPWDTVVMDPTGLSLWYQHTSGSTVHSFRAECTLDAPLEHPLALAKEFDLAKTWNKYILESIILEELGPSHQVVSCVTWMPWPLRPIEIIVEALATELWAPDAGGLHPGITVNLMPVSNKAYEHKLPASHKKNLRLTMQEGSWFRFTPLPPGKPNGPERSFVQMIAHVDSKMRYVPRPIITFILKVLAPFIFKTVKHMLGKNFEAANDPIPRRMQENNSYYQRVRNDVARHLRGIAPGTGAGLPAESWVRQRPLTKSAIAKNPGSKAPSLNGEPDRSVRTPTAATTSAANNLAVAPREGSLDMSCNGGFVPLEL